MCYNFKSFLKFVNGVTFLLLLLSAFLSETRLLHRVFQRMTSRFMTVGCRSQLVCIYERHSLICFFVVQGMVICNWINNI